MKTPCNYKKIIRVLDKLHAKYPTQNVGRHLSMALDGYIDLWGLSDKEMLYALEKYAAELEFDMHPEEVNEIERIMRDGMNLHDIDSIEEGYYGEND